MTPEEYKLEVYRHLTEELHFSAKVADKLMADYEKYFPAFLEDGFDVATAATYIAHNY